LSSALFRTLILLANLFLNSWSEKECFLKESKSSPSKGEGSHVA
jgi:hypothetical protein